MRAGRFIWRRFVVSPGGGSDGGYPENGEGLSQNPVAPSLMDTGPDDCIHLTVGQVAEIHAAVLEEFGGMGGIADQGLLESAGQHRRRRCLGSLPTQI